MVEMQPRLIVFKTQISEKAYYNETIITVGSRFDMNVGGTSMVLDSRNSNLLGEPLWLNFDVSVVDSMTMEPRENARMIVVGAEEHDGGRARHARSLAARLLRLSRCPVTVVPHGATTEIGARNGWG